MPDVTEVRAQGQPCPMYPDMCDNEGLVEPELADGCTYHECLVCGYGWGWQKIVEGDDTCALGVPEAVRKAASLPVEAALNTSSALVDLGSTIRLRPGA